MGTDEAVGVKNLVIWPLIALVLTVWWGWEPKPASEQPVTPPAISYNQPIPPPPVVAPGMVAPQPQYPGMPPMMARPPFPAPPQPPH